MKKNGGRSKKAPDRLGTHRYVGGDPPSLMERLEMLGEDLRDVMDRYELTGADRRLLSQARANVESVLNGRRS